MDNQKASSASTDINPRKSCVKFRLDSITIEVRMYDVRLKPHLGPMCTLDIYSNLSVIRIKTQR